MTEKDQRLNFTLKNYSTDFKNCFSNRKNNKRRSTFREIINKKYCIFDRKIEDDILTGKTSKVDFRTQKLLDRY